MVTGIVIIKWNWCSLAANETKKSIGKGQTQISTTTSNLSVIHVFAITV